MITPKKTFIASPFVKGWTDLMDSKQFHAGAQAALAQMEIETGHAPDIQSAACGHYQMQGAKRFLAILMHLGLENPAPPPTTSKNLRQV